METCSMFKVLFRPLPMIALAAGLLLWGGSVFMKTPPRAVAADPAPHVPRPAAATSAKPSSAIRVEAVTPKQGGLPRITVQPGSVHSFETAFLYAKVSGYLKEQTVDIGDTVKKGQLLAVIDAPELEKEVDRCQAELDRAKAEVKQAEAAVTTARSQVDAAQAEQAEAQAAIQR